MIASEILGNNRKSGRIQRNILNKNVFVDSVEAFSTSYSDSGLFGMKISGSAAHITEILDVAAKEMSGLRDISNKDLELAKQSLKGRFSKVYTSDWRRIEDRSKALFYTGDLH
eukprot:GHVR01109655.1.p1 GENE.GHVR01109655.1~~GHVR01109655.1.p1  ORF type:complete len:113 (-),score=4.09 GHVR01109655.1:1354-1692(-)